MVHYADIIFDNTGTPVSGASILVYYTGTTTKPTIYSDDGVTPAANPVTSDAYGRFGFYVSSGVYDLVASWSTATYTLSAITISDGVLDQQKALSPITGTGAAQTIFTTTIPTGAVGAGRGVRVVDVWYHEGSKAVTYTFDLNGTVLDTITICDGNTQPGTGNINYTRVVYDIFNNSGVTNAQNWVRSANILGSASVLYGTAAQTAFTTVRTRFSVASPDTVTPKSRLVELL